VVVGALVAAVLFLLVQQLVVGSIISLGGAYASYGVVGGVMLLLFWIFLMSQILFIGGELTYAYASMYGSRKQQTGDGRPETEAQTTGDQRSKTEAGQRQRKPAARANVAVQNPKSKIQNPKSSQTAAGIGVLVGVVGTLALLVGGAVVSLLTLVRRLRQANGNVKRDV
jgi:predicted lipid-binding transport protein (Tim44 family)